MSKISVIIPVYNSSRTIANCINSVLRQSYLPHEIIVIDDASTDHSRDIIESYVNKANLPIVFKFIPLSTNCGVSYCRNLGLKNSTSPFVAFLDSDDVWHVSKLELVMSTFLFTRADLVGHKYSDNEINNSPILFNEDKVKYISTSRLLIGNVFQTSSVVMRRCTDYLFDEKMSHCEDYDLFLRLSSENKVLVFYNESLVRLARPQLSRGGLSGSVLQMRCGEINAIRKFLYSNGKIYLLPFFIIYSLLKFFFKKFKSALN